MKSSCQGCSPYASSRFWYSRRFGRSKIERPASTTVIRRPDLSSESFSTSIAAVMPPPMTQTSHSWVGMASLTAPERCRLCRRDLNCAAGIASDSRLIAEICGRAASEVVGHQVGNDVLAVGAARQIRDAVLLESFFEQGAALLDCQRGEAAASSLGGFLQRRQLRAVVRGGRWSRSNEAGNAITVRQRNPLAIIAQPQHEVVNGVFDAFGAEL